MQTLKRIYTTAAKRYGGGKALEAELPKPRSRASLSRVKDAKLLAELSKAVFRAGFVWRVVEAKWPGFEDVFLGFEPTRVASLTDAEIDAIGEDKRVIRNRTKLLAVRDNAQLLVDLAAEHGRATRFVAGWPGDDIVGLWEVLKRRGSRLGGNTGPMALRMLGKDTFLLTDSVVTALRREKVLGASQAPTSKRAHALVQEAFNKWQAESGRSLSEISKILACSVD